MRCVRAMAATAFACGLLIGCGDANGPKALTGSFMLRTVNGSSIPAWVAASDTCDVFLMQGTLAMRDAGTFDLGLGLRVDCSGGGGGTTDQVLALEGAYSQQGQILSFVPTSAMPFAAQISGDVLTASLPAIAPMFPTPLMLSFTRSPP
jgi:hypothetical protein